MNRNSGSGHVFISHSSKDDEFVKELRLALEGQGIAVWADSRELRVGDELDSKIKTAIETARQFIVVLSQDGLNSRWVHKEILKAHEVMQQREDDYAVIPLLMPGIEPGVLEWIFSKEPVAVSIEIKPGGLMEALSAILAALGERDPDDHQPIIKVEAKPVEELILELLDPEIHTDEDGRRRASATATLIYEPADADIRNIESKRFRFTAPLGPIEAEELHWYLEDYYIWPVGVFAERAKRIEKQLPVWGQELYKAALESLIAQEPLNAWKNAASKAERRFSVLVDSDPPDGASDEEKAVTNEAASAILSLPWELLHDGRSYLFRGKNAVRVRRRLPNRANLPPAVTELPIRILLVSPRPDDEHTDYIDHRISARPLIEAMENLGELASVTILGPPTFPALEQALKRAADEEEPFDVVHFDGHGVYDAEHGLGSLCFENPEDAGKLHKRRMVSVDAEDMAGAMRDYRVPLVFLEACQTAKAEEDPTASVAGSLLKEGVTSVVAMSHSVLVETARRFVTAFYKELAHGKRVGDAMIAGRLELMGNSYRGKIMGSGELHLQDWFVPVLYQEEQDPQLFTVLMPKVVQQLQQNRRQLSLGELPPTPPHRFIGRSRELLALERLLLDYQYAVVRGQGGSGKTALVVELARWLVRTGRFQRAAFVSVETFRDTRSILDSLGHQLLPGEKYSVAQYPDLEKARRPIDRRLRDHSTIIVIDNMESILPDFTGETPPEAAPIEELFDLCQALLKADSATRLTFTSREPLPKPFGDQSHECVLRALSQKDAIELVSSVMTLNDLTPKVTDPGKTPEEITDLVEAANRHARALVLLAQEISQRGVKATTENLHQLMVELDNQYPEDRERSLYASVELSLRRLPPDMQEQIKPLAAFHGGANIAVLGMILNAEPDTLSEITAALVRVGLAEDVGGGHYRLDPALPPYLLGQMNEDEQESIRERWAEGMTALTNFLSQQLLRDARLVAHLTLLELPNFLAMLKWVQDRRTPDEVIDLASSVETPLARLGRPRALAQVISIRQKAAERLGKWGRARFQMEDKNFDRLLDSGDLQAAYAVAQKLLKSCLDAGKDAYPDADYDTAMAHFNLGRVLRRIGSAEAALRPLAEAQKRFQMLAEAGNTSAIGMASASVSERGNCLTALGRLDGAADAYKDAIRRSEQLDDRKALAVGMGQLGTVRMLQGRYDEALEIYSEALNIFEALGERGRAAIYLHQIGMLHREAGRYEQAEQAHRRSLAISVQQKNRSGEANSLTELGILYDNMGRPEEAVKFCRQAIDIRIELGDLINEGRGRHEIAIALIKLGRYSEARREILRAIKCYEPYGHVAEPWKAWQVLQDLEQATSNTQAAAQAREQAIQSYLSYRRAGGVNQPSRAHWCSAAAQAIQQGTTAQAKQELTQLSGQLTNPQAKIMITKLQAILNGDRAPSLAEDPELYFQDAVELQLLLENLREMGK